MKQKEATGPLATTDRPCIVRGRPLDRDRNRIAGGSWRVDEGPCSSTEAEERGWTGALALRAHPQPTDTVASDREQFERGRALGHPCLAPRRAVPVHQHGSRRVAV